MSILITDTEAKRLIGTAFHPAFGRVLGFQSSNEEGVSICAVVVPCFKPFGVDLERQFARIGIETFNFPAELASFVSFNEEGVCEVQFVSQVVTVSVVDTVREIDGQLAAFATVVGSVHNKALFFNDGWFRISVAGDAHGYGRGVGSSVAIIDGVHDCGQSCFAIVEIVEVFTSFESKFSICTDGECSTIGTSDGSAHAGGFTVNGSNIQCVAFSVGIVIKNIAAG